MSNFAEARKPANASASRERVEWVGALARADGVRLAELFDALRLSPGYTVLRGPEIGLVMVRGRAGATGDPFNVGEATATRCSLRLESGEIGHACALGRDRRKAEIAALCDALLQTEHKWTIEQTVLAPLRAAEQAARADAAARAAATRVEFFTLVRGEDA